jgi:hypothetical protein
MITKTHFRLCRFGYPLYWPDFVKKDLLYIPAFQYLKVKNFVERDCETMI